MQLDNGKAIANDLFLAIQDRILNSTRIKYIDQNMGQC
jgi:hypothetical protein